MDEMPPSAPSYPDGRQHRAIQQRPRTLLAISWTHVSQYRPAGAAARGNSANPARSSRSFPGGTACPMMAIPRGTCSPRTINAGPEVPAMRRPPAHRRGTKTGQLRAGRWPIQWDRGRFQSLWFWKPLESPILSRPKLLLPSVVSSWHGPDAPLASTVDLVAMQVPNFSDYHKHLPGRNGGEEGIGTNNGHLGDRAQLRLSEEGEGPWWGARLERALPRLLPRCMHRIAIANRPCALHRKSIGQRPFWATTNSAPLELLNVQGQATE